MEKQLTSRIEIDCSSREIDGKKQTGNLSDPSAIVVIHSCPRERASDLKNWLWMGSKQKRLFLNQSKAMG